MDLIDRYLAAIRQELPPPRAEDIISELREELLDRIDAREAELGRPLDKEEISAILKAFGPPLVVAGRYRDHQYLIGPETYPYFLHALRVSSVVVVTIFFFSAVLPVLTGASDPTGAFLRGLASSWLAVFVTFTIVTLLFAVGERFGMARSSGRAWTPAMLPRLSERKKGKWESPIQIGLTVLLLLLWTGIIPIPVPVGHAGRGVHLMPTAVWSEYYWPVLMLGLASLVYGLIDWLRPNRRVALLVLGLTTRVGWIWALGAIYAGRPWFVATGAAEYADKAAKSAAGVNAIISIAMVFAMIGWTIGLAAFIYRHYQRRNLGDG